MVELQDIRRSVGRIDACLRPAARCPTCGHPVIAAPLCDGERYICPDCGKELIWVLTGCHYCLDTVRQVNFSADTKDTSEQYPGENEAGFKGQDG